MKQAIRIDESQLREMITESVKNTLNELQRCGQNQGTTDKVRCFIRAAIRLGYANQESMTRYPWANYKLIKQKLSPIQIMAVEYIANILSAAPSSKE